MTRAAQFEIHLQALMSFVEHEGHARVPVKHVEGDLRLGQWVGYMRSRGRAGLLEPSRIEALEAVPGWEWGPLRPGPPTDVERDREIRRMWQSREFSLREIGDQYGLSRQRVHQIVNAEVTR